VIAFWPYRFTDIEESTHRVEAHRLLPLLAQSNSKLKREKLSLAKTT
jgi:hypothetical protein